MFLDYLLHLLNLVVLLHRQDLVFQDFLSLQPFLDCLLHLVVRLNLLFLVVLVVLLRLRDLACQDFPLGLIQLDLQQ